MYNKLCKYLRHTAYIFLIFDPSKQPMKNRYELYYAKTIRKSKKNLPKIFLCIIC